MNKTKNKNQIYILTLFLY